MAKIDDLLLTISQELANRLENNLVTEAEGCPWDNLACAALRPYNPLSGSVYRGINWFTLMLQSGGGIYFGVNTASTVFPSGRYATFAQWLKAGMPVRKGEHSHASIMVFKPLTVTPPAAPQSDDDEDEHRFSVRWYQLFAAEQVTGSESFLGLREHRPEPIAAARDLALRCQIEVRANRAINCFVNDAISPWIEMSPEGIFRDAEAYASTLFHELVHATKPRLKRDAYIAEHVPQVDERYAFEELVAELGAALLCGLYGFSKATTPDHIDYCQQWIEPLRRDRKFIQKAMGQAQKAVDYLVTTAGLADELHLRKEETPEATNDIVTA